MLLSVHLKHLLLLFVPEGERLVKGPARPAPMHHVYDELLDECELVFGMKLLGMGRVFQVQLALFIQCGCSAASQQQT